MDIVMDYERLEDKDVLPSVLAEVGDDVRSTEVFAPNELMN